MRWSEFAQREPRLAALGHRRLVDPGVVLVGTIRRDGTPRISPVEPLVWERDLWLSMLLGSYKAADLKRDPRILVHSIVTGRSGEGGEYKVRGEAIEEREDTIQRRYASEVSARLDWSPEPGRFTCSASTYATSPSSATRSPPAISTGAAPAGVRPPRNVRDVTERRRAVSRPVR